MSAQAVPMWKNNTWYHATTSNVVVVFVHGIFSDSNDCWRNKRAKTFWPELVKTDPHFADPSVFLGGYEASLGAGRFDVPDAAEALFSALRTPDTPPAPLSKSHLVFVCHSQGGLVVRRMLCSHPTEFAAKHVGLVLCASPSWGSRYAAYFAPLLCLLGNLQAIQMRPRDPVLVNLDRDFELLLARKQARRIEGICLVETRGPLWPIPFGRIVWEDAASRYFPWRRIPKASHFAVVKPDSTNHPSHMALRDFATAEGFLTRGPFLSAAKNLLEAMDNVTRAYDPLTPRDIKFKSEAAERLLQTARETVSLSDREDRLARVPLPSLLTAALDAGAKWIFYDLSRGQFLEIRTGLEALTRSLEEHHVE